jgi:glutamate 5-kinase
MADDDRAHDAARRALGRARRVVVKIGSKAIGEADAFARLAAEVSAVLGAGKRQVVLVSSGAIALGVRHLGMARRPTQMPALQAAAAAGQGLLMHRYGEAFGAHGVKVAQVLLSHADLASRARANNARAALGKLLELGVVPIINENDAVAVDEIKFGDNDELAAMVASLTSAELLVLLSDVDGLYDGSRRRVPFVAVVDEAALGLVTSEVSSVGRGGMRSKLESARRATLAGAHVVIANAREPDAVTRILGGEDLGTLLPARARPLSTRKHWIAYTLRPRGAVLVDAGAARAVGGEGKSVLCVGVVGVRGAFVPGDLISVCTLAGEEIARGLAGLSAADAARYAGARGEGKPPLVHRDDLVVLPR